MSEYKLYHGDCLEVMPTLEEGSVDAVIADIPYFRITKNEWDRQWETIEEYQQWVELWAVELKRVVSKRASIYIFSDDKVCAYVQVILDKYYKLLNNIVWFKTNNLPIKTAHSLRSYAPMTERILFYTSQYCSTGWETVKLDINNFLPLRHYFKDYQEAIGLNIKQINDTMGNRRAEHAFYWNSTQWELPTKEVYKKLTSLFCVDGFELREYESLRREYESLRRVFNASKNTLDVICGSIVSSRDNTTHPTTKPLWLTNKLVSDCTNEGDTVLDFTMGSGTTGVSCGRLNRNFIGIEKDLEYFNIAQTRIKNAYGDFVRTDKEKATGQMALFEAVNV